ncbi:MAG: HD domain-containing protein [Chitinophagaceae bacterium]|nr:HD domain-containing protein [Chitinophagaceae bacterium]
MDSSIYRKTENYIEELFQKMDSSQLAFHNLNHTKTVVQRAKEIAAHHELSERDMLVLFVAAWFHDVGYLFTGAKGHEEKSAELARNFLSINLNDPELITEVVACIMATKYPRNPRTLLEEIICDADTYHFGTKDFKETNKQVFKELMLKEGDIDKEEWNEQTLDFIQQHTYYTAYCRNLLDARKQQNIRKLEAKAEKKDKIRGPLNLSEQKNLPTKGIQTMLRLTSSNHLDLSEMADHKANILISVNSIIISVILGLLFRKLQDEPYLTIPSIMFLLASVSTIVVAILATRPKLGGGTFTTEDVINKKTNLLFFGNFHKAPFEQYNEAMRKMMRDPNYLYGALINDIYQLAVVLGRKYRLIRLAYNIFMFGLVISVIAFAIAIFFFKKTTTGAATPSGFPL